MLIPERTRQFKKDLKKFKHRITDLELLFEVIDQLIHEKTLDAKYCNHPLSGPWKAYSECHIKPNLLLIYRVNMKTLRLERLGSHSELFE